MAQREMQRVCTIAWGRTQVCVHTSCWSPQDLGQPTGRMSPPPDLRCSGSLYSVWHKPLPPHVLLLPRPSLPSQRCACISFPSCWLAPRSLPGREQDPIRHPNGASPGCDRNSLLGLWTPVCLRFLC